MCIIRSVREQTRSHTAEIFKVLICIHMLFVPKGTGHNHISRPHIHGLTGCVSASTHYGLALDGPHFTRSEVGVLSSAEAQRGFSGGEFSLSNVSAGTLRTAHLYDERLNLCGGERGWRESVKV